MLSKRNIVDKGAPRPSAPGHRRKAVAAVALVSASLSVLVACSSSSKSTTPVAKGGSSSGGGSASASGSPILIGTMAPSHTPTVNYGGIFAGLKAAVASINASGGVNGHPLKAWTCNSQNQAAQELACARQAVSNHVVAMIGTADINEGAAFESILSKAGIADIENTGPQPAGRQGPTTFPLTWPSGTTYPCYSKALADAVKATSVTSVSDYPPSLVQTFLAGEKNAADLAGLKFLPQIYAPFNSANYAPFVAQAQQQGAGIVFLVASGAGPQAFVRAASNSGAKFAICMPLAVSGAGGFAGTGSEAANVYTGIDFAPLSSDLPEMKQFLNDMAAEKARGDADASTAPADFIAQIMETWLGVQAFKQAAATITGAVDSASFLKAMSTAKVSFGGIIPDVDFGGSPEVPGPNAPGDVKALNRIFQSTTWFQQWDPATSTWIARGKIDDAYAIAAGQAK